MNFILIHGGVSWNVYLNDDSIEAMSWAFMQIVTNMGRLRFVVPKRLTETDTMKVTAFFEKGAVEADMFRADGQIYGVEIPNDSDDFSYSEAM